MELCSVYKIVCCWAGFVTSKVACCGQGPYNGLGLCTPLSNICRNRDLYAFWDAFHPSERANRIIVRQILTGSSDYMSPMNLSTIMALDSASNVWLHHLYTGIQMHLFWIVFYIIWVCSYFFFSIYFKW